MRIRKGEKMEFEQMMALGMDISYDSEEARKAFFRMLDEALDELEQGKVLTEEQMWEAVDAV